jgi:hypothetical protein
VTPSLTAGAGGSLATTRSAPRPSRRRDRAGDTDERRSSLFYHDGTERPIQRPVDADEQQEYYSGKKKCHTIKNILLIDVRCCIRFLSATYVGKWHDKARVDDEQYRLPAGSVLYQDMGFQGVTIASVHVEQPTKKPRGGELTDGQKAQNHRIASEKMRIEHTMA